MTPEQLAALKAGMPIQDVLAMSAESDPEVILAAAAQIAMQTDPQTSAKSGGEEEDLVPAVKAEDEVASLKAVNAQQSEELTTLKAALAEAQTLAASAQTAVNDLKSLQAAHASVVATMNAMAAPLKAYAVKMGVALSKPVDLEGKSPAEILAAHADLSAGYAQAFTAGRKSAPVATETKAANATPNWLGVAAKLNF